MKIENTSIANNYKDNFSNVVQRQSDKRTSLLQSISIGSQLIRTLRPSTTYVYRVMKERANVIVDMNQTMPKTHYFKPG